MKNPFFDQETPEEAVAAFVDSVKHAPEQRDALVELLCERIPLYQGRGANQIVRIRGYILAAFEQAGLPDSALPYVLEELESGREAYLVAAAAKALRGLASPTRQLAPFLIKAVENIRFLDDAVTFDQYKPQWPLASYTTALAEIFRTLGWLGANANLVLPALETMLKERSNEFSQGVILQIRNAIEQIGAHVAAPHSCCCAGKVTISNAPASATKAKTVLPGDIEIEDQDGNRLRYDAFFTGKPCILVFFYTRCNNPNKCSLTITKLAGLQQQIAAQRLQGQLRTAAITYDPEYDLPLRLKAYGENRGIAFSAENRIFRTRSGFEHLQEYYQLGVNFSGTIVNRHRIELFVLDRHGRVVGTFSRLRWDTQEVLNQAKACLSREEPRQLSQVEA